MKLDTIYFTIRSEKLLNGVYCYKYVPFDILLVLIYFLNISCIYCILYMTICVYTCV